MPRVPIELPDLGAPRAVLSLWYARVGDRVFAGDRVAEVLIPGATVDVPAPVGGVVAAQAVLANDPLVAGQLIGEIQED
ncbi:branched-chain alpha-keto acid dehydrogenase subunit E2 [Urbifossiella limnaea]|uniref:Branched-chain alpha-keto acid dehydrogenase subunit E2 n=1 Tax=Urbifossiella limnaea TaxID=2528023 RepID=A0A517XZE8_9BACT|nr:branched-chain alpha-keto acid dehydrogenase subunit E2 [Urbifossiella limnaea]